MSAEASPARVHGPPGDGSREPWGLAGALADLVAPARASAAVAWVRNVALAGAVLPWLLPRTAILGVSRTDDVIRASVAFGVAGIVAHVVRNRRRGGLIAGAAIAFAAVVANAWPGVWPFVVAGIGLSFLAGSRVRRALRLPDTADDGHRGLSGIAWWVAWVLVAKEFAVLPIHVPTGSMQPAIQGASRSGSGDHILVDRAAYVRHDPRRWDIAVFDYPMHRPTTFVKRVIGLPGETVEIRDGDIWIDGRVARRPAVVQDSMWREVYPQPYALSQRLKPGERWRSAGSSTGGGWDLVGETFRGTAPKSGGESVLRYARPLEIGDVRVRFSVGKDVAATVAVRIWSRGTPVELVAPAAGAAWELRIDGAREASLAPGTAPDELAVADGLAIVRAAGREVARAEVGLGAMRRHGVEFAVSGGGATVSDVSVALDQVWTPAKSGTARWEVPVGRYFVLGDNSAQSEDSREWNLSTLALPGGGEVQFAREYPGATGASVRNLQFEGDEVRFTDVDGVPRSAPRRSFRQDVTDAPAPFVPRGHFIGRATFVIWSWGGDGQTFSPRLLP